MKTQDQEEKHVEAYTHMKETRKSENTGGVVWEMVRFWHNGIEKKNKHM